MALYVHDAVLPSPWLVEPRPAVGFDESLMNIAIRLPIDPAKIDTLAKFVDDVSDPTSAKYAQYLSMDAVNEMVAPHAKHVADVTEWLNTFYDAGARYTVKGGASTFYVEAPVTTIETMFSTTIRPIINVDTKQTHTHATSYVIPSSVQHSIDFISGLHQLPLPHHKRKAHSPIQGRNDFVEVTPKLIADFYNVTGVNVTRSTKNRQAIAEFQGQNYKKDDLTQFFRKFVDPVFKTEAEDSEVYNVIGDWKNNAGVEAELDVQYIMGAAPGIKTEFWGFQKMDFCGDMLRFTDTIMMTHDAPHVFSISYGWQGDLGLINCRARNVETIDVNFMKIAARGISMIVSSGDSGSGYQSGAFPRVKASLTPSWPASSPYVTAVGGTKFIDQDQTQPEKATDQFGSGGGFSWQFNRSHATWQEKFVNHYFRKGNMHHPPPQYLYAPHGRGTPDVSGLAEGYAVYVQEHVNYIGGTSASAPMFAGLVSLLNEYRLQNGKPPLGLLNHFLYQNADAFTDVTTGTGAIDRSGMEDPQGWEATKGWDAVTGLGTPKFGALLEAVKKL